MANNFKERFGIPDLDFLHLTKPATPEEEDAALRELNKGVTREERLAFVERMEAHPEALTAWDMDITFDEYARRVRAGDYD